MMVMRTLEGLAKDLRQREFCKALEKEIEADFDIATLGIGSGTWVLEGDVMTLTDDPLDEDTLILHKV